jgi:hypothetical protein
VCALPTPAPTATPTPITGKCIGDCNATVGSRSTAAPRREHRQAVPTSGCARPSTAAVLRQLRLISRCLMRAVGALYGCPAWPRPQSAHGRTCCGVRTPPVWIRLGGVRPTPPRV